MKRIKIGFLAIIAIMAMSFTIASHEGIFDKAKDESKAFNCLKDDAPPGTTYYKAAKLCINGNIQTFDRDQLDPCPNPIEEGKEFCAELLELNDVNITCNGTEKFCCAEVITGTLDCENDGCDGLEDHVKVYCMPTPE